MPKPHCFTQGLLLVLSLTLSLGAVAKPTADNERWYQINLLVFQHLKADPQAADAEQWPQLSELAYPRETIYLREQPKQLVNPLAFEQLDYGLTNIASAGFLKQNQKIRRSAGFRTLFYKQWYQKLGKGVTGRAIVISGGKKIGEQRQLGGWVRFSQKRYLHLEVDLWLHEYELSLQKNGMQTMGLPQQALEQQYLLAQLFDFKFDQLLSEQQNPQDHADVSRIAGLTTDQIAVPTTPFYIRTPQRVVTYVMNQKRRMKSKQLHYIDHPLLGIIVEAIPYEANEVEKIDKQTAAWLRPVTAVRGKGINQ